MSQHELPNFITGLMGFIVWTFLCYKTPEHSINIALGILLILIGFGGRETIIRIIKVWKK